VRLFAPIPQPEKHIWRRALGKKHSLNMKHTFEFLSAFVIHGCAFFLNLKGVLKSRDVSSTKWTFLLQMEGDLYLHLTHALKAVHHPG
jgi:hypothetical protein